MAPCASFPDWACMFCVVFSQLAPLVVVVSTEWVETTMVSVMVVAVGKSLTGWLRLLVKTALVIRVVIEVERDRISGLRTIRSLTGTLATKCSRRAGSSIISITHVANRLSS